MLPIFPWVIMYPKPAGFSVAIQYRGFAENAGLIRGVISNNSKPGSCEIENFESVQRWASWGASLIHGDLGAGKTFRILLFTFQYIFVETRNASTIAHSKVSI